jgi:hypothetical protein
MLGLDWSVLANFAVSSAVGAITSWVVSSYYFHKTSRAEQIADQIKAGLQKALVPVLYPRFFDPENSVTVYPNQPPPANTDIPHVEFVLFSKKIIRPGQRTDVLIKLRDSGFDLENPHGVTIRDHKENPLGVVPLGLGYVMATFHTALDDHSGSHSLTVALQDLGEHAKSSPNHNVQTISFPITLGEVA